MDLGLRDVHVLVTGASGGIGLSTARLFLRKLLSAFELRPQKSSNKLVNVFKQSKEHA
jgi:NAD(P)-dependent dehydrogenase (short-subunit alcohol dehydrogenase family)